MLWIERPPEWRSFLIYLCISTPEFDKFRQTSQPPDALRADNRFKIDKMIAQYDKNHHLKLSADVDCSPIN